MKRLIACVVLGLICCSFAEELPEALQELQEEHDDHMFIESLSIKERGSAFMLIFRTKHKDWHDELDFKIHLAVRVTDKKWISDHLR